MYYKRLLLWLKNVFGFSQTEVNGFLVLVVIMTMLLTIPFFISESPGYQNFESDKRVLDSLVASLSVPHSQQFAPQDSTTVFQSTPISKTDVTPIPDFDPNQCSRQQWEQYGLSGKIAERISNFLKNGGSFKTRKDLLRIYGFPKSQFALLEKHILLPDSIHFDSSKVHHNQTFQSKNHVAKKIVAFEINLCTKEDLMQIQGIGDKLSDRILLFRDNLGGFYSKNQYSNIYGLDSSVVARLSENTTLDPRLIRKTDLNLSSKDDFAKHPYIDYKLAQIIVNYRQQHGHFSTVDQVKNIHPVNQVLYDKLAPYLTISNN